jgi:hypothetical protein
VYVGDPKSSPSRFATIGDGTFLENAPMILLKSCTRLSISQGMALTPNKFFDLSADTAATLLYFSKEKVFILNCTPTNQLQNNLVKKQLNY